MSINDKLLLDINGLSELLSMGKTKINELQKNGILPKPVKPISQSKRLWAKKDIEKWIENMAHNPQKVS